MSQVFPDIELFNKSSFSLYSDEGWFFKNCLYLYIPNNVYTYVMNSMFSAEIVETLPMIKSMLLDTQGNVSKSKLIMLRIGLWGSCILISFTTKDIVTILNISGSLLTPVVSYFGPVQSCINVR